eukprot:scaffold42596_cov19-Tisochrysis_lutea.AAC.3
MCNVTCHDEGASQAEAGADGALRQLLPDMVHGLVQVNLYVCVCVCEMLGVACMYSAGIPGMAPYWYA